MDTAKYCIYHKQDVELYYVQMIKCRTRVDLNINTLNHNLSLIKQHPFQMIVTIQQIMTAPQLEKELNFVYYAVFMKSQVQ